MPAPIEHEESSDGEDEVPFRNPKAPVKEEDAMEDVIDNEEDQGEEDVDEDDADDDA